MKKHLVEFIGAFFLVLTIGLTDGNPLAIGGVLAAMVYMGGYISGGHYNPAVTLAIWVQKKLPTKECCTYMLAQLAGALAAVGAYHVINGGNMTVAPGVGVGFGAAFLVEVIFTFALVSVVLHTAVSKKVAGNDYYGLAIGLVLMVGVIAGGHISGGAFNPAVGLAPSLYDLGTLSDSFSNICLYLVGPFAGGFLASLFFGATAEGKKA